MDINQKLEEKTKKVNQKIERLNKRQKQAIYKAIAECTEELRKLKVSNDRIENDLRGLTQNLERLPGIIDERYGFIEVGLRPKLKTMLRGRAGVHTLPKSAVEELIELAGWTVAEIK